MFRVSQSIRELLHPTPLRPKRNPTGPVVIWNLTRRCNLACKHCYAISSNRAFPGELETDEILSVMADLRAFGVPALILSGGEPLLHPDLFLIAERARSLGFYVTLSTNGTMIDDSNIDRIAAAKFDYVGISLDGIAETHDRFRRKEGAFASSLDGIRRCRDKGIKVGVRFTLTEGNSADLPSLLHLLEEERIAKFYLSHLNYAGRGNVNRKEDAYFKTTRDALDLLFEAAYRDAEQGGDREFVTGNNDADAVYLLQWAASRHPDRVEGLRAKLEQWGGNSTGVNVANIDNLGNVHPDTMWWEHTLGNVRERPFSEIWGQTQDPLMLGLRQVPRQVKGRCATCAHFAICGGNTRSRALQLTGDPWSEDPGCYLTDEEIAQAACVGGAR
ncbi:MAG TPA: heme d1 biosynthesis radical SAM protein NirJ [Pantanalinema sp.]